MDKPPIERLEIKPGCDGCSSRTEAHKDFNVM